MNPALGGSGLIIEQEKIQATILAPGGQFHGFRQGEPIAEGLGGTHAAQQLRDVFRAEGRAQVQHPPLAHPVFRQGGLAGIIPGGIAGQHRRALGLQHVVEQGGFQPLAVQQGIGRLLGGAVESEVPHIGPGQRPKQPGLGLHHAAAVLVLVAGAAADHQRAARFHIAGQQRGALRGQDGGVGVNQHIVVLQLVKSRVLPQVHHVVGGVGALGPLKHACLAHLLHPLVPAVVPRVPLVVVVLHKGHPGRAVRAAHAFQALQGVRKGAHLLKAAVVPVVIVEDAVPVDFRAHGAGAPPEEGHKVRPMGHALHGPQRQLTGPGRGALHAVVPAVGPGLLLHDAKVRAYRAHLRQHPRPAPVVHGIGVPGVIQLKGKAGVAVVGHHVQALVLEAVVVQIGKQAVGGDVHPGGHMLPEDIRLNATEADGAVGHKAAVIQQQVGVHRVGGGGTGHIHLRPVGVGLVPEHGAPGVVEGVEGAVFLPEKIAEGRGISLGVEIAGFAVDFVVNLPAHDGRMMPVVPGQLLHNAGAQLLINRRVIVVVLAAAVAVKHTVHGAVEHLGILFRQPGRGRGGGGAEDDLHAHPGAQI